MSELIQWHTNIYLLRITCENFISRWNVQITKSCGLFRLSKRRCVFSTNGSCRPTRFGGSGRERQRRNPRTELIIFQKAKKLCALLLSFINTGVSGTKAIFVAEETERQREEINDMRHRMDVQSLRRRRRNKGRNPSIKHPNWKLEIVYIYIYIHIITFMYINIYMVLRKALVIGNIGRRVSVRWLCMSSRFVFTRIHTRHFPC